MPKLNSKYYNTNYWGHSSVGRAPAWHAGGQRFESAWLHKHFAINTNSLNKNTQE